MQEQIDRINKLRVEKNAVILAHNYQVAEIQDIADHVGDSLQLARLAAETTAETIILCGVHFMAETAKMLAPNKTVIIPDKNAGCSLADSINAEQLAEWKKDNPEAIVVSYVNTTAEIKALTDICCTSSNAVDVVNSIPLDKEILFLPDQFLGAHVKKQTGRDNMKIWMGEFHVHAGITSKNMIDAVNANPNGTVYVHPECGCTTSALYLTSEKIIPEEKVRVLSTGGMLEAIKNDTNNEILIATEIGMIHQLNKAAPTKKLLPVNPQASCKFMKMITIEKLVNSLETGNDEIFIEENIINKARVSVERMIKIGNPGKGE